MNLMCFVQMSPFTSYCDVSCFLETVNQFIVLRLMMTMLTYQRGDFTHTHHLDVTPVLRGEQRTEERGHTAPHPNLIPIRSKREDNCKMIVPNGYCNGIID